MALDIHNADTSNSLQERQEREKVKIVVADDDQCVRQLVKEILSEEYFVIEARDGREAIRQAIEQKPALVLLDVLMPVKDGLLACNEIKNHPQTRHIPVMMISGVDSESNKFLASTSGSSGYLAKPFTPDELLRAIARLLDTKHNGSSLHG
jgi:CheY-like chemotaxis protein